MNKIEGIPVIQSVLTEQLQGHETRQNLYIELEKEVGVPLVTFTTSFRYPVMIEDSDADMLEDLLQKIDLTKGLGLIITSPGGSGLAAERIINICKSYSGTGDFIAIVPVKAKSAATMICLGASKIMMSPTSELGPIDPQITLPKENKLMRFAVCNIVQSYKELFEKAVKEKGNLQPYLQQLQNYDAREIKEFESSIALSIDVAIRALGSGMMKDTNREQIEKKISRLLTPEVTKTHGRAIFYEEAKDCELTLELIDLKSRTWKLLYELYIRMNNYTSTNVSKCIENKDHSFAAKP